MTDNASTKRVFIIAGAAASGKSTYAEELREQFEFVILDLDDSLDALISSSKDHIEEVGMENFLKEIRNLRYADLQKRGVEKIKEGASVALVAPFSQHIRDLKLWTDFCEPFCLLGLEPELHWLNVDKAERADRLARRGEARDSEKVASPARMQDFLELLDAAPPIHSHIEVKSAK